MATTTPPPRASAFGRTDGYRAGVRAGQRIPLNLPLDGPREATNARRKA